MPGVSSQPWSHSVSRDIVKLGQRLLAHH
jgi:hypothetical protein